MPSHTVLSPQMRSILAASFGVVLAVSAVSAVAQPTAAPTVVVAADGTVHMPAQSVPVSGFLSPEGKAYLAEHLRTCSGPSCWSRTHGVPPLLAGYIARQRELFPSTARTRRSAACMRTYTRRRAAIAADNRNRVLIDLHGGGFRECWPACAELESMPIAALGRIKVVSLDYRQGPKHRHPAASEDVAAAYRELLKTYRPENIGIYGCSAGGMLTAMSVAWFQQHGLPRPGAVGILCAGAASFEVPDSAATRATRRCRSAKAARDPAGRRRQSGSHGLLRGHGPQRSARRAGKLTGRAREVSADVDRDGHAGFRAQQRRLHAHAAREASASMPTCTSGRACSTASSTTPTCRNRASATT